jgi:methylglutaconyl-CoA hydratase
LHCQLEPLDSPNEGIFMLSLTRSEAKNSIGKQMLKELQEALNNLRQESSTRCVVIRSTAGGVFSSGADLKERAAMSQQEALLFVQDLRATFNALAALPMPTIAAVDGFALGGGAELALACDLRVCNRDAQFAFPETRLGIIPGAGGTQRLPRIVGPTRAKELIFTGRRVDAHEALRIGLVDHFADEDSCETAALSLARDVAAAAPLALRMAKAAVNWGVETDLQTGLKIEEACYAQVLPTEDRLEGLRAFSEKRAPKFHGR